MGESKRVSRVTVPEHANPHAKIVFQLMREHNVTYDALEYKSGVLRSTLKSYRVEKTPSLQSIEALLGAFGWTLVPCPPLSSLPQETLDAIEEISLDFKSDNDALAAIMARVCRIPVAPYLGESAPKVTASIDFGKSRRKPKVIEGQAELGLELGT